MNNLNHPYPKQIFVFGNDTTLGVEIARRLEVDLSNLSIQTFPDGERIPHQTETVRGRDVYVIFTSQNGPESDKWFIDYLRFVHSIKEGQPYQVTVVIPKLPHQRQDVEDRELRQATMSDFFPRLFKTAGADKIVVCKLHNPASRTKEPPMENIDTTALILSEIRKRFNDTSNLVIASGDMGGSKYARKIAEELQVPLVITDKDRDRRTGDTKAMKVYTEGEISKEINTAIFVDDLISTFGTLRKAANALSNEHSQIVNYVAIATHADFGFETMQNIIDSKFRSIWVTDTVPVKEGFVAKVAEHNKEIYFISVAELIAKTIDNLHNGESVSKLWIKQNGQMQHS